MRQTPVTRASGPARDGSTAEPEVRVHEGYGWLYVLSGRLRLVLADAGANASRTRQTRARR